MEVALFVPCYIDQFYPRVAAAALEVLERLGCIVHVPLGQTCCGQPMANAGFEDTSGLALRHFEALFDRYEYVVGPSASCVLHLRQHLHARPEPSRASTLGERTFELCQFLVDVLGRSRVAARFPARVALHQSCHGLRGLRLGSGSERMLPPENKVRTLLEGVDEIELIEPDRADECCGFGGTFSVTEPDLSAAMGTDRLEDYLRNGAEVVTATDSSCLMHLEGLARRQGLPLRFAHVAEILAGVAA